MQQMPEPPRAAIVHHDERLIDLVQYELELAGVETSAVLLRDSTDAATIASFLAPAAEICIVGVPPQCSGHAQLFAELRRLVPGGHMIALTPAPTTLSATMLTFADECVREEADLDVSVQRVVGAVRRRLFDAPAPVRFGAFTAGRVRQALEAACAARARSLHLRAQARALRSAR